MKATLIIVENEADLAEARALIEQLMKSKELPDRVRMAGQQRLIEAYEHGRWPRRSTKIPSLWRSLVSESLH